MGQTRCPKDYDSPRGLCTGQIYDIPRVSGLLRIHARFHRPLCLFCLPRCRASQQLITSVEFKFVARQVVASVVIRAVKLTFVAESGTRVYFAQHCILLRDKIVTNAVIRATMCFNLQCNNVARQVEEKCCPYYRTLSPCATNKLDYFSMQLVISHRVWLSLIVYSSTFRKKCLPIPCIYLSFKGNIIWTCAVRPVVSPSVVFISFAKKVAMDFC